LVPAPELPNPELKLLEHKEKKLYVAILRIIFITKLLLNISKRFKNKFMELTCVVKA